MIVWDRMMPDDQWDQHVVERLLEGSLYPHGLSIWKHENGPRHGEGYILLVPGRYWSPDDVSEYIDGLDWVLAIRTSDEEDTFDIQEVEHPNIRWWVQTPRTDRIYGDAFLFGVGFPEHFDDLQKQPPVKAMNLFLSAQNNHKRRADAFQSILGKMEDFPRSHVEKTEGFTQGLTPGEYRTLMIDAKVAPAPSGVFSPDSFRVWEALESHTIPVVDDLSPKYDSRGFWAKLCPDAPFPVITNSEQWAGYCKDQFESWTRESNRTTAWWMQTKRKMAHRLVSDLKALGALDDA